MTQTSEIGLVGLGTMGAMLALNIADNGFAISVYNRTVQTTRDFHAEAGALAERIFPTEDLESFVASLRTPRMIILMVPAGDVVDDQIAMLRPLLGPDDLIVDAGNANFRDTERRAQIARETNVPFLGIGVSGGEEGARHGPSIMGGGPRPAWDRISHILTAIAADYEGEACATWMGDGGAGHFVKTVHNGIEYADMQMIAEIYGVLRDGLGRTAPQIGDVFERWNEGILKSYLVEISGEVSHAVDAKTGSAMLDIILDRAGQKGTGRWTVIEAQHLGAPIPVIEAAVAMRNLSAQKDMRVSGEGVFGVAPQPMSAEILSDDVLEDAMIAGKIMCYAQGFALLDEASETFDWTLPMPEIARVWREGCIIRSAMLNDMAQALQDVPGRNLLLAPYFTELVERSVPALRHLVASAIAHGHNVPALAAGLSYFDAIRTGRSTANMIQAQRDFFGAHSFERVDEDGAHHGPWAGQF